LHGAAARGTLARISCWSNRHRTVCSGPRPRHCMEQPLAGRSHGFRAGATDTERFAQDRAPAIAWSNSSRDARTDFVLELAAARHRGRLFPHQSEPLTSKIVETSDLPTHPFHRIRAWRLSRSPLLVARMESVSSLPQSASQALNERKFLA
jgi:hypothetical protein